MRAGRFITLDGGEGSGKSTNLAYIEQVIKNHGKEVIVTREPGGTEIGEKIRTILLDRSNHHMDEDTELLLMFAARAQHLKQKIIPALQQGKWVLSDRFVDASYAYQGGGRGIDSERIQQLDQWVRGDFKADLTIYLDLDVEVGMQRAKERGALDRFEVEQMSFFERVRSVYLQRAQQDPEHYAIIDASPSLELVQKQIDAVLSHYLENY